jgi:hypothetical protein
MEQGYIGLWERRLAFDASVGFDAGPVRIIPYDKSIKCLFMRHTRATALRVPSVQKHSGALSQPSSSDLKKKIAEYIEPLTCSWEDKNNLSGPIKRRKTP